MTEQQAISDYLDARWKTSKSVRNRPAEIELLRELRTRLISDVVTGKLDVREVGKPPGRVGGALIEETDDFIESDAELESAHLRRGYSGDLSMKTDTSEKGLESLILADMTTSGWMPETAMTTIASSRWTSPSSGPFW